MDYWILSTIESVIFIGLFLAAIYLFVPKAIKFWRLWKESGKTIYLSNAIASGFGALLALSADFIKFIKTVGGW